VFFAVAAPSRFIFVSFAFGKVRKGEARKKMANESSWSTAKNTFK
jgi:hypothetical protein